MGLPGALNAAGRAAKVRRRKCRKKYPMTKTAAKTATETTATTARAKKLGGKLTASATKGATALTGAEGAYLRELKAKAERAAARGAKLKPEQQADLERLEAQRIARNEYAKQLRKGAEAPKEAAPAAAPVVAAKVDVAMVVPNKDGSASHFDAARNPIAERPALTGTLSATNVLHSAMTISKADLVGALRVQLVNAERSGNRANADALRIALQLAQLLAD